MIKILDGDGRELPTGESGEVYMWLDVWPDFTYAGDEEKRRAVERDGLVSCGDIGYLDADGYLYLNDRRSDMVISGGVNIYPAEIEACLLSLEGVRDCAVFGIPDDEFGEALAAHVELDDGARLERGGRARARAREARRLQDPARGRVQRLAAARGLRARSSSAACASPTGAVASARSSLRVPSRGSMWFIASHDRATSWFRSSQR